MEKALSTINFYDAQVVELYVRSNSIHVTALALKSEDPGG